MPSRREIIDRAMVWVRAQVPYSQVRYRDGYRTDCSGFVSMAWMLPRSYWTGDLNTAGRRVALRDCQPGDMLLFHNLADPHDGSHVVIFDGWVDRNLGDFWILEQTGAGRRVTRRIRWSQTGRRNLGQYVPYQPLNVMPETAPIPDEGEPDMRDILAVLDPDGGPARSTVWHGHNGTIRALRHPSTVEALRRAGATFETFPTADELVEALGVLAYPDDNIGYSERLRRTMLAVESAG